MSRRELGLQTRAGKSLAEVQEHNRALVLQVIREAGPIPRRDLARITGLTASTIGNVVSSLKDAGLVIEMDSDEITGGRRPILVDINVNARYVIGIRIARHKLSGAVFNLGAEIVARRDESPSGSGSVRAVVDQIEGMVAQLIKDSEVNPAKVAGIGIGAPGPVSVAEGKIRMIANFANWRDIPLRELIEARCHFPTLVEHDASAAAVGERWFGAGKGVDNLVYIAIGRGLGAGIIINGEMYRGVCDAAGQIGHTTVKDDGPLCDCGNQGCLERIASTTVIVKKAKDILEVSKDTLLREEVEKNNGIMTPGVISRAASRGDKLARDLLFEFAHYAGIGVVNMINTLNPELIILGGEMWVAGAWWVDEVKKVVERRVMPEILSKTRIVPAGLGEDSVLVGTGAIVIERLFKSPRRLMDSGSALESSQRAMSLAF